MPIPTMLVRGLGAAALYALIVGCSAPPAGPVDVAQRFWEHVIEADYAAAATQTRTEAAAVRDALDELEIAGAEVERLEVPPQTQQAYLPTRITLVGRDAAFETVSALERDQQGWRVRLRETAERVHADAGEATRERLSEAARALGETLSERAHRMLEAFEREAGDLAERSETLAERYAEELASKLEEVRRTLAAELARLERELRGRPEDATPEDPPKPQADPEADASARGPSDGGDGAP